MGRLFRVGIATPSEAGWAAHEIDAVFDLAGNMTDLRYPDGRTITQSFDGAGRLASVKSGTTSQPGAPFISGISYLPSGTPQNINYGNGVSETFTQNSRLQPCHQIASSGSLNLLDRQYFYNPSDTTNPCNNEANNNGNIFHIVDGLPNATNSQNFQYDGLNRLTFFEGPNMSGAYRSQNFSYDSFGNIAATQAYNNAPSGNANVVGTASARMFPNPNFNFNSGWPYDANNRLLDSTFDCIGVNGTHYDAAGNVQCGGSNTDLNAQQYTWDADGRIARVNAQQNGNTYYQRALYTYDASGNRMRSDQVDTSGNSSSWREYSFFNGEMLAEKDQNGNWTDYIYANGQKVARADAYDQRLHLQGTRCDPNACGQQSAHWDLPFVGYTIKSGDRVSWRQYQAYGAIGGLSLQFANGQNTNWNTYDTSGQVMNNLITQNQWVYRTVDLSAFQGQTVNESWIGAEAQTAAGSWHAFFADIVIYGTDGTVTPIFHRQTSYALSPKATSSVMANLSAVDELINSPTDSALVINNATYYISDHLGTAQLEFTGSGYPAWAGQVAPFGQELTDATFTSNRYKFTGKERDTESGLDYFGARYYGSSMGRWISPDWSSNPISIPFARLDDPQTLNLYGYVGNNPMNRFDPFGHSKDCGGEGDPSLVCIVTTGWDWLKIHIRGSNPQDSSVTTSQQDNFTPQQMGGNQQSLMPRSASINFGGGAEAGLGAGFAVTGQASLGLEFKTGALYTMGTSGGTFPAGVYPNVNQSPDPKDWVTSWYAGGGFSGSISNGTEDQMAGQAHTYNLGGRFGPYGVGVSVSYTGTLVPFKPGVYSITVAPPFANWGAGAQASHFNTNTSVHDLQTTLW